MIAEGKKHYVLIEDFNTSFIISWKKTFLSLLFTCFHCRQILKSHIKDCFKINGKQTIKVPKKGKYFNFRSFQRKIKLPFMIYADFESILVPEANGKQSPNESYKNMLLAVMVID